MALCCVEERQGTYLILSTPSREHAEKTLKGMSRMDPAYRLYGGLLQHAKDNIDRQADERRAMELEDE
jgi:hypothetical protein